MNTKKWVGHDEAQLSFSVRVNVILIFLFCSFTARPLVFILSSPKKVANAVRVFLHFLRDVAFGT